MTLGDEDGLAAALVEAVPMPLCLIGADDRIAAMNAPARAVLGEGLLGRLHVIGLRQPALQQAIGAVRSGAGRQSLRLVIAGESQDAVYDVTVGPLQDGQPAGALLVAFADLTLREQAERMRRDFVANVSHELRTPLTALMGFIETLRGAARDDAPARERFLGIMEREAGRMNRLVRDLLQLSRVEAEERVRPRDPVDLAGLVRGAVAVLRPAAEARGVALLESGTEVPLVVPGDADQLTQVVSNLVENAVKYGGSGGRVEVSLRAETLPDTAAAVRLVVRDFGEGIDPLHLPRLTERFYRVDTHRSREQGGTGLGLAIVKHIVNRHRGRLKVESVPGQGSTFTVVLPAA